MGWGGARAGAGRWSKDEIAAFKRGDSDEIIAAINGRTLKAVRAKRIKLKEPTSTNGSDAPKTVPAEPKAPISTAMIYQLIEASKSAAKNKARQSTNNPFKLPEFPQKATPPKKLQMAMDENIGWANNAWATGNGYPPSFVADEGLQFFGYPYLTELAQRPEYRVISETIADDATRKWIDFEVTGDEKDKMRQADDPGGAGVLSDDPDDRKRKLLAAGKTDKVKALKDEMARLEVLDKFYTCAVNDGLFGRSHLFIHFDGYDLDDPNADKELMTPVGDGRDELSKGKIGKNALKALRTVEPIWVYPTTYNAVNPLKENWYNPDVWWVLGKQVHRSRLPVFVGHPVPDLLKPAYSFGGLSLSQMAKPYVDIWLTTRQSVADLIHSFSVMVLMTDLQTLLQSGGNATGLIARAELFSALRDNQGLMVVNKATEDFKNVSASLAGLHELQAQAQEHMAAVSRIPLVKLTGISPSGLNACLPGDTLILTNRGQVPIRDITLSDLVMTRRGLAPLVFSGMTKYANELIEINTSSATLRCTANHPIWLPSINAFVPAENVRQGNLLLLTGEKNAALNMHHPWHGADNGGGRIQADIISRGMLSPSGPYISIGKCGKRIADLFQNISISTTLTEIKRTIRSPILSRCMGNSMLSTTASNLAFGDIQDRNPYFARNAERYLLSQNYQADENSVTTPVYLPIGEQTGYLRQKDHQPAFASGVARLSARFVRMLSFVRVSVRRRTKTAPNTIMRTISRTLKNMLGINEKPDVLQFATLRKNTSDVALSSYRPDDAMSNIARNNAKIWQEIGELEKVVSVRRIWASEPVYDLTVAPEYLPEFFANRILTHNSSEGEIRAYYDTIAAYQNRFMKPNLSRVINFMQLSLFGEIDPEITWKFEPLWEMSEKEKADLQKANAERHQIYVDMGAFAPAEIRKIAIDDPEQQYTGLDADNIPDLREEIEAGLEPEGGRPQPLAEAGPDLGAEPDENGGGNSKTAPKPAVE